LFVRRETVNATVKTSVEIDGRSSAESQMTVGTTTGSPTDFVLPSHLRYGESQIGLSTAGLDLGRHELRVRTTVAIGKAEWAHEARFDVEVAAGTVVRRAVRLLKGDASSIAVRDQSYGNWWSLWADYRNLEHPFFGKVQAFEDGRSVGTGTVSLPAGVIGGSSFELDSGRLPRGRHELVVRFTPDAQVAFDRDPDATAVLDETFERKVSVNVP
jgi:hypothetical protein